jgi:hypothetical protein
VDIETDEEFYSAPRNPANTGTRFTSGNDLYYHTARSGNGYWYTYHWSMWQGESSGVTLISAEDAKEFLLHKNNGNDYNGLTNAKIKRAEALFPGIFDEDA